MITLKNQLVFDFYMKAKFVFNLIKLKEEKRNMHDTVSFSLPSQSGHSQLISNEWRIYDELILAGLLVEKLKIKTNNFLKENSIHQSFFSLN